MADRSRNPAVVTLTLSPCIDKSTRVEKFMPEKKLRCDYPVFEPGGGGLNVSGILYRMGIPSLAVYLSGGYTGRMLDEMIAREHYGSVRVESAYQTRENFIVYEKCSHLQYRFGMPENPLSHSEQRKILQILENINPIDVLVLSGSVHASVPEKFFRNIFSLVRKRGGIIFADTSREALKKIIPLRPDWVKPNRAEWLHFLNRKKITSEKEWILLGRRAAHRYGIHLVVSDGENGAWFFRSDKEVFYYPAPEGVRVRSTVGAGDSMVSGIIYAQICHGLSSQESIRYGMAFATSTVTNKESEFCKPYQIQRWLKRIHFIPKGNRKE